MSMQGHILNDSRALAPPFPGILSFIFQRILFLSSKQKEWQQTPECRCDSQEVREDKCQFSRRCWCLCCRSEMQPCTLGPRGACRQVGRQLLSPLLQRGWVLESWLDGASDAWGAQGGRRDEDAEDEALAWELGNHSATHPAMWP